MIFQVETVRPVVQPIGEVECYTQTAGQTSIFIVWIDYIVSNSKIIIFIDSKDIVAKIFLNSHVAYTLPGFYYFSD